MGIAKARRIAGRVHQGQLTETGELFVDHLERVAATVEELGGGWAARQAAWLYALPRAGVDLADLARQGVNWRVRRVVEAMQSEFGRWWLPRAERVLGVEDAELVYYAVMADQRLDPGERLRFVHEDPGIAARLGLPWPPEGAPEYKSSSWPVAAVDADELPALLAEYRKLREHKDYSDEPFEARSAIRELLSGPIDLNTPAVAELAEQWWDSADDWEAYLAVLAARGAGLLDRERLLRKVTGGQPIAAAEALRSLSGPGDQDEIEALRTVVGRLESEWRWARGLAATRLIEIGGPDVEAVLGELPDLPWQHDRTWLRRYGRALVPQLIEALSDPAWWHAAPFALGELRAAEAVGPLCESVRSDEYPIPQIEALGKIGSVDAVPTLIELLLAHHLAEVRVHALQALDKIEAADVVDAAIKACDDVDISVRDRAARVLIRRADARSVTQLIRLSDTRHAAGAVDALARIGDPRALPTLWYEFKYSQDKATRYAAGRGLARIEGRQPRCDTADPQIRRAYVWLLGHKPDWDHHFWLKDGTRDVDALVRARAAEAYGRLGDPAGTEHVRPLLTDPDPRVRTAAKFALDRLGG